MNSKRYSVPVTVCKQAAADSTKEIGYCEAWHISAERLTKEWQSQNKGADSSALGFYALDPETGEWERI